MHRSLLAAVVLGVVGVFGACSVLLDFRQCAVSGDCGEQQWCSADGLCRTLLTEHCTEILGNYTSDGILLGGILSLSGRSQESGDDARSAILLAVDEINDNGGVGGNQGGRMLSVLLCDDAGEPNQGVTQARYLVEEVGVPALLGPNLSRVAVEVAQDVALPNDTLLMTGSATAVSLTTGIQDPDNLIWRTATIDSFQADTLALMAEWLATARLEATGAEELDVGVLYASDPYGSGLSSLFGQAISLGALDLKVFPYDALDEERYAEAADQILQLSPSPELIAIFGYEETSELLRLMLEGQTEGAIASADILLADGGRTVGLLNAAVYDAFEPDRTLVGTIPARGNYDDAQVQAAFDEFEQRYTDRFGGGSDGLPAWAEQNYDATYLLALAAARVDETNLSGKDIANALSSLTDAEGEDLSLLLSRITDNMRRMGEDGSYYAEGASGTLTMDENGDRANARIGRWTVDRETGTFRDCGPAMSYADGLNSGTPNWCNLRCEETSGDDDDSAGDDCAPE